MAKNILFLLSDEHHADFLGHRSDGAMPTPHLDALARHGRSFTQAWCQMPLCGPSRASLLSGRRIADCDGWDNHCAIPASVPIIPAILKQADYRSALIGKMHFAGQRQFQGFDDRPYGDLTGGMGHQWEPIARPQSGGRDNRGRTADAGVSEIPESLHQDRVVGEETLAWIRNQAASRPDQPWLCCASFSRPHFPFTAPQRWIDRLRTAPLPPPMPAVGDGWSHPFCANLRQQFAMHQIAADEADAARRAYAASVCYLDEIIGDLLQRAEADGLLDDTLIIYTSDHGEMAGDGGMWLKDSFLASSARVPLLLSTPHDRHQQQAGKLVQQAVGLDDLLPTMCAWAGVPVPAGCAGQNLLADQLAPRTVFTESFCDRWGPGTEWHCCARGDWQVIVFADEQIPKCCFNLIDDPYQQHNRFTDTSLPPEARLLIEEALQFDFHAVLAARGTRPIADLPGDIGSGNCYHLADGRVVDAGAVLYQPQVLVSDVNTLRDSSV